jgi:hypothetical protein
MTNEISAMAAARWKKLRLQAIAMIFDTGDFVIIALGVVVLHLLRLGLVAIGIDPEIVKPIRWMEIGASLYLFGAFFWRIVVRATKENKTDE